MRSRELAGALTALLLLAGCRAGAYTEEELDQVYPLARMQYLRKDAADEAFAAIEEKVGAPFNVVRVDVQSFGVNVEVQDPRAPAQGDLYVYSFRQLRDPQPQKNWKPDAGSFFPFREVVPARFSAQAKSALAVAGVGGGHVSSFSIRRGDSKRLEVTVGIDGPRGSSTVVLDHATGAVVRKGS